MAETWQQRSTRERAEASFGFGGSSLSRIKRQRLMRGDNGKRLAAIVSRSRAAIAAQSSGERSGCMGAVGEPGKGFPPLGLPAGSMAGPGGEKGRGLRRCRRVRPSPVRGRVVVLRALRRGGGASRTAGPFLRPASPLWPAPRRRERGCARARSRAGPTKAFRARGACKTTRGAWKGFFHLLGFSPHHPPVAPREAVPRTTTAAVPASNRGPQETNKDQDTTAT